MITCAAVLLGFFLDIAFGDPAWIPHPVVLIGKYISLLERHLRNRFPKTPKGERRAGRLLTFLVIFTVAAVTGGISVGAYYLHPIAYLCVNTLWCWQALAWRGLRQAGLDVMDCLKRGDILSARKAVHALVGRDVDSLNEEQITKATVESIAENSNDGIIAPLIYMLIGGGALAMVYKAINTMDSMLGYKNERYLNFGRASAKTDDVAGYVPARIAGIALQEGAALVPACSGKEARRIRRRDGRLPASPNAGLTEAACAGALGIQLGGPAPYFGEMVDKPYLGDAHRPAEPDDIRLANRMVTWSTVLVLVFGLLLRALVFFLIHP